jgi:hypothetical protein
VSGACFSIDLFLRLGPFPPPSPPPLLTALFEGFSSTMRQFSQLLRVELI